MRLKIKKVLNKNHRSPITWGSITVDPGYQIADVNGDGLPDIICGGYGFDFYVLVNTGAGFLPAQDWASTQGLSMGDFENIGTGYHVFTGDFNGDGLADIVCVTYDDAHPSGKFSVFLSTGSSFKADKNAWGYPIGPLSIDYYCSPNDFNGGPMAK